MIFFTHVRAFLAGSWRYAGILCKYVQGVMCSRGQILSLRLLSLRHEKSPKFRADFSEQRTFP
jgi:hypothetical protein